MKDLVIPGRALRRELIILGCCLLAVYLANVIAIHAYGTSWRELYSVWYAVLFVGGVLYALLALLRLVGWGLWMLGRSLFCKK